MKIPARLILPPVLFGFMIACGITGSPPLGGAISTAPERAAVPSAAVTIAASAPAGHSFPAEPRGLTAVNNFEPGRQEGGLFNGALFDARTYANPNISGISFRTSWEDVEPTEGAYIWSSWMRFSTPPRKTASGSS